MPQIKKQISVAFISLLFLLAIVPFVNATSETFAVPASGTHDLVVNLNQGDTLKVNITIIWEVPVNQTFEISSISFKIKDAMGNTLSSNDIQEVKGIKYRMYGFSAPATGKYMLQFEDTSYRPWSWLNPNLNKTVMLNYTITPYNPVLIGGIFVVAVILAVAGITFASNSVYQKRKRQKAIVENSGQGNLPNSSLYDEMLTKRARAIVSIKDGSNVSWEDSKKGILLRCKNAWLSNTEFFYTPSYFPISNMNEASVNEKNILTIRFKNNEIKEFKLAPDDMALELTNKLAVFDQEFANETFRAYLKTKNQQWADTITKLIHEKLEADVVTCEHCGAKNKLGDTKCFYCGAIL
jgi:hypothetical protein